DLVEPRVEVFGPDDAALERDVGGLVHAVDLARGVRRLVAVAVLGDGDLDAEPAHFLEARLRRARLARTQVDQVVELAVGALSEGCHGVAVVVVAGKRLARRALSSGSQASGRCGR